MDSAAKSLAIFGAYLLLNAFALLFFPNAVLASMGLPASNEPWVRVLGLLAGIIGYYYVYAARHELRGLYPATVHGRLAGALVFLGLVLTGLGPWQLLMFGVVDLLAALWTRWALLKAVPQPQ